MNFNNIKIVLAGESNSGKTCLIYRLIHSKFVEGFHQTIATSSHDWTANLTNKTLDIKIWDTAGQEKYRSLAPIYFRDAYASIIVFDVLNPSSIESIQFWIDTIRQNCKPNAPIAITANKIDLISNFQEIEQKLNEYSKLFGIKCFITSSKTGEGVENLFLYLANEISLTFPIENNFIIEENKNKCNC